MTRVFLLSLIAWTPAFADPEPSRPPPRPVLRVPVSGCASPSDPAIAKLHEDVQRWNVHAYEQALAGQAIEPIVLGAEPRPAAAKRGATVVTTDAGTFVVDPIGDFGRSGDKVFALRPTPSMTRASVVICGCAPNCTIGGIPPRPRTQSDDKSKPAPVEIVRGPLPAGTRFGGSRVIVYSAYQEITRYTKTCPRRPCDGLPQKPR